MNNDINLWILIAAVMLTIDIILISRLMLARLKKGDKQEQKRKFVELLNQVASGREIKLKKKLSAEEYLKIKHIIILDQQHKNDLEKALDIDQVEAKSLKNLKSRRKLKRLKAIVILGELGTVTSRLALERALIIEKDFTVRIYIANALTDIGHSDSIPLLVNSLINSHKFYRSKVNMMIVQFGDAFYAYLPIILESGLLEMKELILDFSASYYSELTKDFLIALINDRNQGVLRVSRYYQENKECCKNCIHYITSHDKMVCEYKGQVEASYYCRRYKVLPASIHPEKYYMSLVYRACEILSKYYPEVMIREEYIQCEDHEIRNYAIKALANTNSEGRMDLLLSLLGDPSSARTAGNTISFIIEKSPRTILMIAAAFKKEENLQKKQELARILAGRIEYFILKLDRQDREDAAQIIKEILLLGRTNEVVDFLNNNKDVEIENELLAVIKELIAENHSITDDLRRYLNERLLNKLNLTPYREPALPRAEKKDRKLLIRLYVILSFSILCVPVIYFITKYDSIRELDLFANLKSFVIDFNYYLAFYSLAINFIYFLLLILSALHAKKQNEMWLLKSKALLFKERILPTVSIIAPAYNEEKTIIESANSLLNLKYPDYELIIVNDGSKDNTLDILIRHFNLKRADYLYDKRLNTKTVRGIYLNRSLPKLIVVDKENGGKADSLNAGINIAKKEYYCGIDADSLLEEEALLRLAALTLDEGIETPALGGNILPINGCTVELGQIKKIRIPDNRLARLQTMEYIRAFMAGRMGWAKLNSLLIISGAFGLFRKERVISVGGYLTSSGKYEKDTVGEDMELVVRIARLMRELKLHYRIRYSFNANCWTEVPETLKILKKQRYRWHKGLIDILSFHQKMIFNPGYGRIGLVAMPYFFLFEMLGPMLEFQGYLMVIVALFLGLLNQEIVLILFVCTILFGTMISVSSLVIAERDMKSFSIGDILRLIGYAILENFGPRQFISFWRVGAFFQMLYKQGGWEKAERKGSYGTKK